MASLEAWRSFGCERGLREAQPQVRWLARDSTMGFHSAWFGMPSLWSRMIRVGQSEHFTPRPGREFVSDLLSKLPLTLSDRIFEGIHQPVGIFDAVLCLLVGINHPLDVEIIAESTFKD